MAKQYKKIVQDIEVNRGDYKPINFIIPGNYASDKIYFTVKKDRELSSDRYVDKANTIGGGADNQILAVNKGEKTYIDVFIEKEDTEDLIDLDLVYDIWIELTDLSGDDFTAVDGSFTLLADVRTPYDNYATPNLATRFQQIDASDFNSGDLLQVSEDGEGNKAFVQLTVAELLNQLGLVTTEARVLYGLKSGTPGSPPAGLVLNEIWIDTTDNSIKINTT